MLTWDLRKANSTLPLLAPPAVAGACRTFLSLAATGSASEVGVSGVRSPVAGAGAAILSGCSPPAWEGSVLSADAAGVSLVAGRWAVGVAEASAGVGSQG